MKEALKIIGIDPGKSGGLAVYYDGTSQAHKMPESTSRLAEWIVFQKEKGNPIVFIEKVSPWMSDSDKSNHGKQFRIQKMMSNYESLLTVLRIYMIPFVEVTPLVWQKYLNLHVKGISKTSRKNKFKKAAQSWYPHLKVINATSDALCLLHFGRRKVAEDMNWVRQKAQIEEVEELPF